MRNRVVWSMAVLWIGLAGSGPSRAQQIQNQIVNGNFETGAVAPWGSWGTVSMEVVTTCAGATVPEGPVEGRYCLHVTVPAPGANFWDLGLSPQGMVFQKGKKYTLSAFLKCKKGTLQLDFKPQIGGDPWTGYGQKTVTMTEEWAEYSTTTPVFATDVTPPNIAFHVGFAAAEFWVDDVKWYEGDYVPTVVKISGAAWDLSPKDGASDVPRDASLSWTPGPFAQTHNVFLGTRFEDVDSATAATAGVEASMGQVETTFEPASLLEYGRVYYWRVDEVNAPPDATVFKGSVWSFTAEPYAYQVTNIQATASSSDRVTNGPQNTVNGSGLTDGGHSTAATDMWVTKFGAAGPAWIAFEFDRPYCLKEVLVWNYNVDFEPVLGYGFKDVTIEYSLNGTDWMLFGDVLFEQATAQSDYAPTAAIPLNGVYAKFIRFTPKSNWSLMGLAQYGLSEVQFFQVPVLAREPQPANGAEGVSLEPTLSWRPGREAVSQKVYFSADRQAVAEGTASSGNASGNSYQPGSLDYGRVYYWRVDEVNEAASPSIREGDVWSFSTTEFFAVDDFEGYNDEEGTGTRIYESWIDGYSDGSSGSLVGNLQPPFAEQGIVHSGHQSMPMDYNNTVAPYYSEAVRTLSPVEDWTAKGVTDLILWVQGNPAPMAAVTETGGKMTVTGEGADIWDVADQFTYVYKTLSGDGVISARVTSKGTGSSTWAKGGVMIRDNLDASSPHAMMVLTDNSDGASGNGASFQYRLATDATSGNSDATAAINAPYYVKIERQGDSLMGSVSPDGTNWTQMGNTQYVPMSAPAYIGICVTSHAAGENRTYTFDNIKTTGATGSWQTREVGLARNSPQDLYVVVEDAGGKSATATNPDLVTAGQWTEWRIPLSSLTGVNLAKVKKLTIGVGDRQSPQTDGAGKIYIDDIRVGVQVQ
jgi:hypothetical protein